MYIVKHSFSLPGLGKIGHLGGLNMKVGKEKNGKRRKMKDKLQLKG
jgi:hypothetical protein